MSLKRQVLIALAALIGISAALYVYVINASPETTQAVAPAEPPVPTPSPSGIVAPPQAAAAGYTNLQFDDEFTGNAISPNDAIAGYNWVTPQKSPVGDQTKTGTANIANGVLALSNGRNLQSMSADGTQG